MRPQKVLDIEILKGLTKVFRSKGYEGASLKDLSDATGLKKASLYHRFPGGKQEMAEAVLTHINEWVELHIFGPFTNEDSTPQKRLINGLAGIRKLYNGGSEVCLFRALSMEAGLELFERQIANGMQEWIATFEEVGLALGFSSKESRDKALQSLVEIQGSLIVARGMDDLGVFERTIQKIENGYLKN